MKIKNASKQIEHLEVKFRTTKAEDSGETGFIAGYASIFSNVDQGRDVVQPGAFAKTIAENNGVFPFLLDHNPYKPAGYSTEMREEAKGLYYEAEFKLHDPEVRQRYELAKLSLKLKKPMGNSFGYYGIKYDFEEIETEAGTTMVRNLREIKLYEASLVTFPMNEAAGVTDAKQIQLSKLVAMMKTGGYSLEELKTALEAFEKEGQQAAPRKTDPIKDQSEAIEVFNRIFK